MNLKKILKYMNTLIHINVHVNNCTILLKLMLIIREYLKACNHDIRYKYNFLIKIKKILFCKQGVTDLVANGSMVMSYVMAMFMVANLEARTRRILYNVLTEKNVRRDNYSYIQN